MYLRRTQRKNRDGSVVRYLQLANSRWVDGAPRAEVLLTLGREDQLDVASLRRLVASINRYLNANDMAPATDGASTTADEVPSSGKDRHIDPAPRGAPTAGLDHFLGRDCELADLRPLLRRDPLVTLTGPAGVGKTRLAKE